MKYREAIRTDIKEMHRIRVAVKQNRLTSTALTESHYIPEIEVTGKGWVAEDDGQIVGFGIANKQTQSIWALFVEPDYEGKGIGKYLLQQMVTWLCSEGAQAISLGTEPGTRAEQLYLKSGWQSKGLQSNGDMLFELACP